MLVIFDQIHYVLNLLPFGQITTRKTLIKLLSNQDQYIDFEQVEKKSWSYGDQISGTELYVNYTFIIFLKNLRCVL